jgi:hypothetical protein
VAIHHGEPNHLLPAIERVLDRPNPSQEGRFTVAANDLPDNFWRERVHSRETNRGKQSCAQSQILVTPTSAPE